MSREWVHAINITDLPEGSRKLIRHYDKRIAIFRTARDIYAVDNRCPHQGYALLQGDVKEEVLTCAWHNWKFALDEGGRAPSEGRMSAPMPPSCVTGRCGSTSPILQPRSSPPTFLQPLRGDG